MRRRALERLGHQTIPVDYVSLTRDLPALWRKLQWRLRAGPMVSRYNDQLLGKLAERPDVLWIDKGMFVFPKVLLAAKQTGSRIVHYSPDNYFLGQNSSRHFWNALKLYDLVVTTKSDNTERLKARGARSVVLSGNAFAPEVHKPVADCVPTCDVSFVGRWEPEREDWLAQIAALGVKLSVRGPHWEKSRVATVRVAIQPASAWGEDYARAICEAKVNLCFLSRLAQDRITQRSVEIPACGGFMLAERTEEHLAHFREGAEAAYFDGPAELCDKVLYYLAHNEERRKIAAAGRARCLASDYSYDARLKQIFEALEDAP